LNSDKQLERNQASIREDLKRYCFMKLRSGHQKFAVNHESLRIKLTIAVFKLFRSLPKCFEDSDPFEQRSTLNSRNSMNFFIKRHRNYVSGAGFDIIINLKWQPEEIIP
jgi:hypothetical protein